MNQECLKSYVEGKHYDIEELLSIVEILRNPKGCVWDSIQTHESLKKNIMDEAEEVILAISKKDSENLCEELGDLLFLILLQCQIAAETEEFNFSDVVSGIANKLIRRHPYIFGDEKRPQNKEEERQLWSKIKEKEKTMKK